MPVVTDYTALLSGSYWTGFEVTSRPYFLTFSFPTVAPPAHADPGAIGAAISTFQAFDAADQAEARLALAEWADASGLTLLEVGAGRGDIEFAWYDFTGTPYDAAAGFAFFPGGAWSFDSDPYFVDHASVSPNGGDVFLDIGFAEADGTPAYGLLLHEIGHALGLKHPFEVFGTHDEILDPAVDNTSQTVMSYTGAEPTTLGPLDRAAVSHIYGAATRDGKQVLSWSWDPVLELLTQEGRNTAEVMQGVSVADSMMGRGGNDRMLGIEGDDTLNGGSGADWIHGGAGVDSLLGGTEGDTLDGGAGNDRVYGQAGDDSLIGGAGLDSLYGGDGADILIGAEDNDRLDGGAGDDLLFADAGRDTLMGGAGGDQLAGGDGNDRLDGGTEADNLFGDAGADTLIGGAGDDSLTGGAGVDRFSFGAGFGSATGLDIIWDYLDGTDRIAFSGIAGIDDIGDLAIADGFFGATITVAGHGTVLVYQTAAASITAGDLMFL